MLFIDKEEALYKSMRELKIIVNRKEGELMRLTHEIWEKDRMVKEKEEEALSLRIEADNLKNGENYKINKIKMNLH